MSSRVTGTETNLKVKIVPVLKAPDWTLQGATE